MAEILVSPLGRAPGAVSGVAYALQEAGYEIERVITLGTSHPDVFAAAQCLKNVFVDDFVYEPRDIPAPELRDRDGSSDAFVSNFGLALEEANHGGNTVHVAVTAGRAGMGALAALATNLYGTDHLWHFWVTDEIAEGGLIDRLQRPLTKENMYLNPTVSDPEFYELVELPFIDLRPLHSVIWEYYKHRTVPAEDSKYGRMLTAEQLEQLLQVFPAGITLKQLKKIKDMAEIAPTLSAEQQLQQVEELGAILSNAGFVPASMRDRLRRMVVGNTPLDTILREMGEASSNPQFREQIGRWLDENSNRIQTSAAMVTTATSVISATASVASLVVQIMATMPSP